MHRIRALLISFIFLSSGCLNSSVTDENDISQYEWWEVPLEKRHLMDLNFSSWRSTLPEKGIYNGPGQPCQVEKERYNGIAQLAQPKKNKKT